MHTLNSLAKANKIAVTTVAAFLKQKGIEGTPTDVGSRTIVLYGEDAARAVEVKAAMLWNRRNEIRAKRVGLSPKSATARIRALEAKVELLALAVDKLINGSKEQ